MPDFEATAASLPGLKDISPQGRAGLAERVTAEVAGAHRWPFLLKVQEEISWAANDAIQSFAGIQRIFNIMYPGSGGDYYALKEMSDIEFQHFIEVNPSHTDAAIWRDAGMDGNKQQIEIYAAPTSAVTLKVDYNFLPDGSSIDDLPFRFQSLILLGMRAYAQPEIPYLMVNFHNALQMAISREEDLSGRRRTLGRDPVYSSRWRNVNNPS